MKNCKKRLTLIAACLSFCVLFITGCEEQEEVYVPVTENTVEAVADGRLIGYIVEAFDKDYYNITELGDMVRAEIAIYNEKNAHLATEAGRAPIIVDKVSMAEDGSAKAVVALNFQNAAVYEDYMGTELFYGTVAEAVAAGYQLEGQLVGVKKGETLTAEQITKNGENHILIVADTLWIRTNEKVQYLSGNASLTETGIVDGNESEELKFIITK